MTVCPLPTRSTAHSVKIRTEVLFAGQIFFTHLFWIVGLVENLLVVDYFVSGDDKLRL